MEESAEEMAEGESQCALNITFCLPPCLPRARCLLCATFSTRCLPSRKACFLCLWQWLIPSFISSCLEIKPYLVLHFLPLEGEKEKALGLAKWSESAVVCGSES